MKRIILSFLTVLVIAAITPAMSRSQTHTVWHPSGGPVGGEISDVGVDSSGGVWVATNKAGCYYSIDHSDHWAPVNPGLPTVGLGTIALSNRGYVFANTQSLDQTFRLNMNLPRNSWHWEIIHTDTLGVKNHNFFVTTPEGWVFANGTTNYYYDNNTHMYHQGGVSVRKSTDNGSTWTDFIPPLVDSNVSVFARGNTGVYVAATGTAGGRLDHYFYETTDDGAHWTKLPGAIVDTGGGLVDMVVTKNGNILVSTNQKGHPYGSNDPTLHGGRIYLSTDNGTTWKIIYQRTNDAYDFRNNIDKMVYVRSTDVVYADAHGPILRSSDGGVTWKLGTSYIFGDERSSLALPPDEKNLYMICEPGGFFRSADSGKSFVDKNGTIKASFLYALALDSHANLFTVSEDFYYYSTDHGASWPLPYLFFGESYLPSVMCARNDHIFVASDLGLYRARGPGDTLHNLLFSQIIKYQPVQQTDNKLWTWELRNDAPRRVIWSNDDGDHWTPLTDIPNGDQPGGLIGKNNMLLLAGQGQTFYLSLDEGSSWQVQTSSAPISQPYKIQYAHDGTVLVLIAGNTGSSGAWQSLDSGKTWNHIFPPGGDPTVRVSTDYFAINSDDENTIFVGGDSGLYRYTPIDQKWHDVGSGLNWGNWDSTKFTNVSDVIKDPITKRYYAASRAQSVFESVPEANQSFLGVEPSNPVSASATSSIVNYPNPFTTSTMISFHIQKDGPIHLYVYDLAGKQIAELAGGSFTAGDHSVAFDGSHLASGSYMLVLRESTGSQEAMMTITK
ncbi:MAG TPA: T9SS type A sorting domain-containing protein [Candidatus Kapabacteria bacterium]|nr:T9SS type A sorting domain-containing protein [Candidatus Kapabacteria bacterium]